MSRSDTFEEGTDEADAIILEESQRVLDHQIDNIKTVEDRAVWLLRIGVVLLGVVVSVDRLFGITEIHVLALAGFGSMALSLLVGIVTYGVSAVDVGAEPNAIEGEVPDDYGRSDVYDAVVAAHEDSIRFNRETLCVNEWFLTLTQVLLGIGVLAVVAGLFASI